MINKGSNILAEHAKRNLDFNGELKQINFLDKRVYQRAEGVFYPSVTTILQYMPKAKFFESWIKDVGHNADIIIKRAGEEGTQTHNAIEDLLAGKEINWMDEFGNARYNEVVWGMILKFKTFWELAKPKLISSEEFTFSDEHKYAGTADLVVELDGETWLLDIKTSNSLHKSYDLQLAAYVKSLEENKGIKITRTGILWLKSSRRSESKKKGEYFGKGWELKPIDDIETNFELFKLIQRLYSLDNPTVEPTYYSYPTSIKL